MKLEGGKRLNGEEKTDPQITVITVVYNCENFLENCIQSVLSQSCNQYEYIIIDGNSTDSTIKIIKQYDDKIDYWISEDDNGIYDAMNKAVEVANGKWLIYMNADDQFESNESLGFLQRHISNDVDFIYGNTKIIDQQGSTLEIRGKAVEKKDLYWRLPIVQQSILIRKTLFGEIGKFNESYRTAADYEWIVRFFVTGKGARHSEQIIARFRWGGITSSSLLNNYIDGFKISVKYFPKPIALLRGLRLITDILKYYIITFLDAIGIYKYYRRLKVLK